MRRPRITTHPTWNTIVENWNLFGPVTQTVIVTVAVYLAIRGITINIRRKDDEMNEHATFFAESGRCYTAIRTR